MAEKKKELNSFLISLDSEPFVRFLTSDQQAQLFLSLFDYAGRGIKADFSESPLLAATYESMIKAIDKNKQKYDAKCLKNSANQKLRHLYDDFQKSKNMGLPTVKIEQAIRNICDEYEITIRPDIYRQMGISTNVDERIQGNTISSKNNIDTDIDIDIDIDTDTDNKNESESDNDNGEVKPTPADKAHTRKPYGEYGNVLLSDLEVKELLERYPEKKIRTAIYCLDSYCEESGKSYKNYKAIIENLGFQMVKDRKYTLPRKFLSDEFCLENSIKPKELSNDEWLEMMRNDSDFSSAGNSEDKADTSHTEEYKSQEESDIHKSYTDSYGNVFIWNKELGDYEMQSDGEELPFN